MDTRQDRFADPGLFLNRELSWLEFNRRVLEEAEDPTQPLLERVRFLSIFSSNLDEFFEIRIAGIKQQIEQGSVDAETDGMRPAAVFDALQRRIHELVDRQYALWNGEIGRQLAEHGIRLFDPAELPPDDIAWLDGMFWKSLFPVLTPLAVDASHPFPQLLNKSANLLFLVRRPGHAQVTHGIVQLPRLFDRLIRIDPAGDRSRHHYVLLRALIRRHATELFPGCEILGSYALRVTRNSDLYFDDEEAENLLRTIEHELRKRSQGKAVRLEVEAGCPPDVERMLLDTFGLEERDVYRLAGPMTLTDLLPLYSADEPELKDRPFFPAPDLALPPESDAFAVMRRQDVLLHHPYEDFECIIDWVKHAAADPSVLAIKMTLYRTSGDSPIIAALGEAAQNGKHVTVLVELRARFDEANNIQWARRLEEAGVHVVYGVVGLKVHAKMLLIVRRDEDRIRSYVHLGTGNYHPKTARLYTDFGLLTTKEEITDEVVRLFNALTGLGEYPGFRKLLVAPQELAPRILELIARERDNALAGRPSGIIIKANSLVDATIIRALYDASSAGVRVELILRGICCLRPGVPGVSKNIRVVSIVGRFLEHSRIFYFANGGDPAVYMGSADLMPRNLYRRVEVLFPIEDPALRRHVVEEVLPVFLADRIKARELAPDGTYRRLHPDPGQEPSQAQLTFRRVSRQQFALWRASRDRPSTDGRRFTPLTSPPPMPRGDVL
ncbi:MAG: polyphosphate kinase 1 [Verrucomicrobiae bacterium]|nr:polyphosphate kinase 1 [Verrucomicrobiae bacterium]